MKESRKESVHAPGYIKNFQSNNYIKAPLPEITVLCVYLHVYIGIYLLRSLMILNCEFKAFQDKVRRACAWLYKEM